MLTVGRGGCSPGRLTSDHTEIDDVAPAHSRTYRNFVSAAGVLCADWMSLFIKEFSSYSCFQQGCRRISGGSLQDRHNRWSCRRGSTRAANRVVRKHRWAMGPVPAIRAAVYEYRI